jgi:hypothetical protein
VLSPTTCRSESVRAEIVLEVEAGAATDPRVSDRALIASCVVSVRSRLA